MHNLISGLVIVSIATMMGWHSGRNYQQVVSSQEFMAELTSTPTGPDAVGFKPLTALPVLKQVDFTVNGKNRKFIVAEIKMFEVSRYGVRSELVLDANDVAVAEIIRATEMNKPAGFVNPNH